MPTVDSQQISATAEDFYMKLYYATNLKPQTTEHINIINVRSQELPRNYWS